MNWARFHQAAIRSHGLLAMVSAVLLVGVMHLVSCTTDNGYLRYQSLRVAGWEYRDSVEFVVDSLPTSGTRQLSVALRKSSSHAYPYTSLTMAVHQTWRLGDSTLVNRIDTMECVFNKPDGFAPKVFPSILLSSHWAQSCCPPTPQGVLSSAI